MSNQNSSNSKQNQIPKKSDRVEDQEPHPFIYYSCYISSKDKDYNIKVDEPSKNEYAYAYFKKSKAQKIQKINNEIQKFEQNGERSKNMLAVIEHLSTIFNNLKVQLQEKNARLHRQINANPPIHYQAFEDHLFPDGFQQQAPDNYLHFLKKELKMLQGEYDNQFQSSFQTIQTIQIGQKRPFPQSFSPSDTSINSNLQKKQKNDGRDYDYLLQNINQECRSKSDSSKLLRSNKSKAFQDIKYYWYLNKNSVFFQSKIMEYKGYRFAYGSSSVLENLIYVKQLYIPFQQQKKINELYSGDEIQFNSDSKYIFNLLSQAGNYKINYFIALLSDLQSTKELYHVLMNIRQQIRDLQSAGHDFQGGLVVLRQLKDKHFPTKRQTIEINKNLEFIGYIWEEFLYPQVDFVQDQMCQIVATEGLFKDENSQQVEAICTSWSYKSKDQKQEFHNLYSLLVESDQILSLPYWEDINDGQTSWNAFIDTYTDFSLIMDQDQTKQLRQFWNSLTEDQKKQRQQKYKDQSAFNFNILDYVKGREQVPNNRFDETNFYFVSYENNQRQIAQFQLPDSQQQQMNSSLSLQNNQSIQFQNQQSRNQTSLNLNRHIQNQDNSQNQIIEKQNQKQLQKQDQSLYIQVPKQKSSILKKGSVNDNITSTNFETSRGVSINDSRDQEQERKNSNTKKFDTQPQSKEKILQQQKKQKFIQSQYSSRSSKAMSSKSRTSQSQTQSQKKSNSSSGGINPQKQNYIEFKNKQKSNYFENKNKQFQQNLSRQQRLEQRTKQSSNSQNKKDQTQFHILGKNKSKNFKNQIQDEEESDGVTMFADLPWSGQNILIPTQKINLGRQNNNSLENNQTFGTQENELQNKQKKSKFTQQQTPGTQIIKQETLDQLDQYYDALTLKSCHKIYKRLAHTQFDQNQDTQEDRDHLIIMNQCPKCLVQLTIGDRFACRQCWQTGCSKCFQDLCKENSKYCFACKSYSEDKNHIHANAVQAFRNRQLLLDQIVVTYFNTEDDRFQQFDQQMRDRYGKIFNDIKNYDQSLVQKNNIQNNDIEIELENERSDSYSESIFATIGLPPDAWKEFTSKLQKKKDFNVYEIGGYLQNDGCLYQKYLKSEFWNYYLPHVQRNSDFQVFQDKLEQKLKQQNTQNQVQVPRDNFDEQLDKQEEEIQKQDKKDLELFLKLQIQKNQKTIDTLKGSSLLEDQNVQSNEEREESQIIESSGNENQLQTNNNQGDTNNDEHDGVGDGQQQNQRFSNQTSSIQREGGQESSVQTSNQEKNDQIVERIIFRLQHRQNDQTPSAKNKYLNGSSPDIVLSSGTIFQPESVINDGSSSFQRQNFLITERLRNILITELQLQQNPKQKVIPDDQQKQANQANENKNIDPNADPNQDDKGAESDEKMQDEEAEE